jgi:hypothetical protein
LAGFQVIINGRFWVITEALLKERLPRVRYAAQQASPSVADYAFDRLGVQI